MKKKILSTCIGFFVMLLISTNANAQEPFLGEVRIFAGNFAPRGWAFCHGQSLSINQNQALFSLIGTMYGGDGRTTFALPDLRGRAAIGAGRGDGLPEIRQGTKTGTETIPVPKSEEGAKTVTTGLPALGVSYIIATQGIFPSRS